MFRENQSNPQNLNNDPSINYTWIGPPPSAKKGVGGHDTACAIKMAEQNQTNPIVFWCLDEHKDHYIKTFEAFPNITVKSVESALDEYPSDSKQISQNDFPNFPENCTTHQAAMAMRELKKIFLDSPNSTVRDRVAFKDFFTLFLLIAKGGYIADTNIEPIENSAVNLKDHSEMKIAGFTDPNKSERVSECFLMYSPRDNNQKARERKIFSNYVRSINNILLFRNNNKEIYGKFLGNTMIDSITKEKPAYIEGKIKDSRRSVEFQEMNVIKHYYNTHIASYDEVSLSSMRNDDFMSTDHTKLTKLIVEKGLKMHPLYSASTNGDRREIELLVLGGADVNQRSLCKNSVGETPLHCAIKSNNVEVVKLLLSLGANLSLEAYYKKSPNDPHSVEFKATAIQLALKYGNKQIIQPILERVLHEFISISPGNQKIDLKDVYKNNKVAIEKKYPGTGKLLNACYPPLSHLIKARLGVFAEKIAPTISRKHKKASPIKPRNK